MTRYFNAPSQMKTVMYQMSGMRKGLAILARPSAVTLADLSEAELRDLLRTQELCALAVRSELERRCNTHRPYTNDTLPENGAYSDLPVEITFDGSLHIFVPFLFRRPKEESYGFAQYVKAALSLFLTERTDVREWFAEGKAYHATVIRRSDRFRRNWDVDNNNFETGAIINVIMSAFGSSDAAPVMAYTSEFNIVPRENFGIEIILERI